MRKWNYAVAALVLPFTGSFPSRFAERIPSTVAFAMAMVVIYGILFFTAALRI